jgi:hypothetical protein
MDASTWRFLRSEVTHHVPGRQGGQILAAMRRKEGNPNKTPEAIAEKKAHKAALNAQRAK